MSAADLEDAVRRGDLFVYSDPDSDDPDDEDYHDVAPRRRRAAAPAAQLRVREVAYESHTTSRLFEIVVMRKHARLSVCLQRLFLTISSRERYIATADILSFICECAGFRHSSITPDIVDPLDTPAPTGAASAGAGTPDDISVSGDEAVASSAPASPQCGAPRARHTSIFACVSGSGSPAHRGGGIPPPPHLPPPGGSGSGRRHRGRATPLPSPVGPCASCSPSEADPTSEPPLTYESFDWWYFRSMFSALPSHALFSEILRQCAKSSDPLRDEPADSLFFPEIHELINNRRSACLSTKFSQLCLERIRRLTGSLEAQDGWTIGFGKRNNAFLRFKEFFQQLVLEAEAVYLGDVLHVFQWIFALSLSGFRAVRQFALVACNEIVSSLLVKLDALSKNERVFRKQLQVEIELDQRTHERVHGHDSRVSLSVSKSSLELYKKLLLAQRGQRAILRFVKCVYTVNVSSKLRDVLVDIRITSAFSLGTNALIYPAIFAGPHYVDLVYRLLPGSDECSRLLLLRYLGVVERRLTEEQFGILLALHESCAGGGLVECCETIEGLMLRDVHFNYDRSVVFSHRADKAFTRLAETLAVAPRATLSVLIASVFLPSVPIRNFSMVFQVRADDLRSKHRNTLVAHPAALGRKSSLTISDDGVMKVDTFYQCFTELSRLLSAIRTSADFVSHLISSLWEYSDLFAGVGETVRFLCQGGDVASVNARLGEQQQQLLLQISLASFEHLMANVNGMTDSQVEAVSTVTSYAPVLLRLYRASTAHTKSALQLIEMATSLSARAGVQVSRTSISALRDSVSHLLSGGTSCEASLDAMRFGVRCLYNVYAGRDDAQASVVSLYRTVSAELSKSDEPTLITLHCAMNLLHYFPLELDVTPDLVGVIESCLSRPSVAGRQLWCAIGYVLYEAQLYKCVKTKAKKLDRPFCKLRGALLRSLAALAQESNDDFSMFVCFSSMVSLVQISSLVGGLDEMPDGVEVEMFNILHHFLLLVRPSHVKSAAPSGVTGAFLESTRKGVTVADVFIMGYNESHFVLNPLESVLCLLGLFTKVLSARLYCSGVSVLILLQTMSTCPQIANASGVYLRFLSNFDGHILCSLLLFSLIGLYESNSRDLVGELCKRFVDHALAKNGNIAVDRKRLSIDRMLVSGVQYALQCPSNWDFLGVLVDFVGLFKGYSGVLDTALLHAQIATLLVPLDPGAELRQKVWHLLNTIGMSSGDLLKSAATHGNDVEGVTRCLNIIRRKSHHVDFIRVTGGTLRRKARQLPSSTCIVKRQRGVRGAGRPVGRTVSEDTTVSSVDSHEATLDVSPIVVRTFTKSHMKAFPPSVGIVRGRSLSGGTLSLECSDPSCEFEPLAYHETTDATTPLSERSSALRYTSSVGISATPPGVSPFMGL